MLWATGGQPGPRDELVSSGGRGRASFDVDELVTYPSGQTLLFKLGVERRVCRDMGQRNAVVLLDGRRLLVT